MNTINMPGVTAETSLYKTSGRYRSFGQRGELQRTVLVPQLGGPGFVGFQNCVSDCRDENH